MHGLTIRQQNHPKETIFHFGTLASSAGYGHQPAHARVYPATPQAFEQVWVKFVCIDLERCAGGAVSMSGNTTTVVRYTTSCLVWNYPITTFVELGQLPAGTYTVNVVNSAGLVRSTQQLTVSDPNPPGPYVLPTLAFPFGWHQGDQSAELLRSRAASICVLCDTPRV